MTPQPGRLDRRITIQTVTLTQDSFGQAIESWADYKTVWAMVEYPSASERFISAGLHSARAAIFTIRDLDDLNETMRIVYQDLYWKITGIRESGRKQGFEISAEVFK